MSKCWPIMLLLALNLGAGFALAQEKESPKKKGGRPAVAKEVQRGKHLEELFRKMDANGDGKVSEEEFVVFKKVARAAKEKSGKETPDKGDKGGAGKEKDSKALEAAAETAFKKADSDGDHFLSLDEFRKLLTAGKESPQKGHKGESPKRDKKAAN